jgi:hypothetical protein
MLRQISIFLIIHFALATFQVQSNPFHSNSEIDEGKAQLRTELSSQFFDDEKNKIIRTQKSRRTSNKYTSLQIKIADKFSCTLLNFSFKQKILR